MMSQELLRLVELKLKKPKEYEEWKEALREVLTDLQMIGREII